jgi:hypothetical protein
MKRNDLKLGNVPIINSNLKLGNSLVNIQKIEFIKSKIIELNNIKYAVAEVGVYKGGSAKVILEVMNRECILYLFDTFEGIPNKTEYDNITIIGDFNDILYDDILKFFKIYDNVKIYKGVFPQDTSKYVECEKFKFVHLDVDTYISYKESLEFFYNKMIIGGYILFDDYNEPTCIGATKAINEFFENKKEKVRQNNKSYYIMKE